MYTYLVNLFKFCVKLAKICDVEIHIVNCTLAILYWICYNNNLKVFVSVKKTGLQIINTSTDLNIIDEDSVTGKPDNTGIRGYILVTKFALTHGQC